MWIWLACLAAAGILMTAVFMSSVQIALHIGRAGENDRFNVNLKALFGLLRFKFHMPVVKLHGWEGLMMHTKKQAQVTNAPVGGDASHVHVNLETLWRVYRNSKRLLSHTEDLHIWVKQAMKHVSCTRLAWRTRVGIADAAETAMLCGMFWSFKNTALGFLLQFIHLKTSPVIKVDPAYNQELFSMEFDCILKIGLGQAMIAGLLLLLRILKVKGGLRTWRNILFKA